MPTCHARLLGRKRPDGFSTAVQKADNETRIRGIEFHFLEMPSNNCLMFKLKKAARYIQKGTFLTVVIKLSSLFPAIHFLYCLTPNVFAYFQYHVIL